jgi:hypothetical protein
MIYDLYEMSVPLVKQFLKHQSNLLDCSQLMGVTY